MKFSSELPLYESIRREFKARIERGELPVGARILPELELAAQLQVSRSTARKALKSLEEEGLITRTAGRGSFVAARSPASAHLGAGKGTFAITVNDLERYNHSGQIVQGFMNAAVMQGYNAIIHPPKADGIDEFEYLMGVRQTGLSGWALRLMSVTDQATRLLNNLRESGCALVLVDRYARQLPCDFVVTKNREMGYILTRELLLRGHREIGMINFPLTSTVEADRQQGYMDALEEGGIPFAEDLLVTDRIQGLEPLRMQMLSLLGRRNRPTAIFCASEHHAPIVIRELNRLGYHVPHDIELAIIDDNRFVEGIDIPVISVAQRSYEMGKEACALLQWRLENPDAPPEQRFLDFKLNFNPMQAPAPYYNR